MKFELKIALNSLSFLVLVNCIIFFLGILLQLIFNVPQTGGFYFLMGALDPLGVLNGYFYLLLTSTFLHFELIHFIVNIYSLIRIGEGAMYLFEGKVVFFTYIFGGIGGSLLSVLVSIFTGQNTFTVGASGAIFALLGLILGSSLKRRRLGPTQVISISDILPIILISLVYGFFPGTNVDNWAHIGGLITGVLLGFAFNSSILYVRKPFENKLITVFYRLSQAIFIGALVWWILNSFNLIFNY